MKVVINTCHGGFSISPRALKRYAELQDKPIYFFSIGIRLFDYNAITVEELECGKHLSWVAANRPDFAEEYNRLATIYADTNSFYVQHIYDERKLERNDPLLIQVVEELGDKANGLCANLKIIEIPDDVDYQIEEYDGSEWVSEKHRTWQ